MIRSRLLTEYELKNLLEPAKYYHWADGDSLITRAFEYNDELYLLDIFTWDLENSDNAIGVYLWNYDKRTDDLWLPIYLYFDGNINIEDIVSEFENNFEKIIELNNKRFVVAEKLEDMYIYEMFINDIFTKVFNRSKVSEYYLGKEELEW